jgi:DNA-binding PucR family transcriptional regulator
VEHVPGASALITYPEVAALSLVKFDKDQVLTFVRDQLGKLASKDRRMAELRQTVSVFLAEGHNARRAAEVLCTHKNTVHYRIARAEEIRRRPIVENTFELELALRLVTHYGDWTLSD